MAKPPSSKQHENARLESANTLTRRPIHDGLEQEKINRKKCVDLKDSTSKSERLYPDLENLDLDPGEDEDNNSFDKFGTEATPQKYQEKASSYKRTIIKKTECATESQKVTVKKSDDSPKEQKLSDSPIILTLNKYLKYFVLLIALLAGICMVYMSPGPKVEREFNLNEIMGSMKRQFPTQTHLTYRIFQKALEKVFNTTQEPSAPAIVTIIANKNAKSIASEFSLTLAKALAPQNYVLINEVTYWNKDSDLLKLKIDDEIRSKMNRNCFNVGIVDNLHNIPYEAAMIFHGYCDHELAEIKRAAFIFIVPLNEILPQDASCKMIDGIAERRLRDIWHKASSDIIDSLIVRMTVNVINIRL